MISKYSAKAELIRMAFAINAVVALTGPDMLCSSGATYSISDLPLGAMVTWTASTSLTPQNGSGSTFSVTPYATASVGWVEATVILPNATNPVVLRKELSLNGYVPIDGPDVIYADTPKEYYTMDVSGASYTWDSQTIQILSGTNSDRCIVRPFPAPGNAVLFCTVTNGCGVFTARKDIYIENWWASYCTIYPNPASSTLHVEIDPSKKANGTASNTVRKAGGTCEVQMVAVQTGALVLRHTVKDFDTNFDLNLTTVPDGLYLLRMVQNGQTVHTKNILVQH